MQKSIDFSQLKEYDSLSKRQQQLLSEIALEKARSNKIKDAIETHVNHRYELKNIMAQKQSFILDKESQVKILSEQKDRLINQGISSEKLEEYQIKIDQLDNESFSLLEEIETLEIELKDGKEFESGARKTLTEIEVEVDSNVKTMEVELDRITSHIDEILSDQPERVSSLIKKLIEKKLAHGPFTKIAAGSCMMCRYKISKTDESDIDVHRLLKQCSQCSRIFIPYGI